MSGGSYKIDVYDNVATTVERRRVAIIRSDDLPHLKRIKALITDEYPLSPLTWRDGSPIVERGQ